MNERNLLQIAAMEHSLHRTTIERLVMALHHVREKTRGKTVLWHEDGTAMRALRHAKEVLQPKEIDSAQSSD